MLAVASLGLSLTVAEVVAGHLREPGLASRVGEMPIVPFAESGQYTPPRNRLGFRQEEPPAWARAAGAVRVAFLGDSFTFGDGVVRGEDRFTDRVERRLNEEDGRPQPRFHVYNAAVSGSRPSGWIHHLRALLPEYDPAFVFAVFFLRDGTALCTSLRCHRAEIEALEARYRDWPGYDGLSLARLVYDRLVARDFAESYRRQIVGAYLGDERETETWRREQLALVRLRDLCAERGIPFHLVIFPMLSELDDYPYADVEDAIARFAADHDIPVLRLLPGFEGRDARELWVAPNDQHPNERGHHIAADTLYPYVASTLRAHG